jgi:anti-anti-sigma factor
VLVRRHGTVTTGAGLGVSDHVCWTYDNVLDFLDAGLAYLADGFRGRLRLIYVSGRNAEQMRSDLAPLTMTDRLIDNGGLALATLGELFDPARPTAPQQQLSMVRVHTERAMADGYAGLRVLAHVTDLVTDPRRRADQVVWEQLADRYMSNGHPVSAFCGYDRQVVGDADLADLAALHPLVHGPQRLAAATVFFDSDRPVIAGTVDAFNCEQVHRLVRASPAGTGRVVLGLGELQFVDARGLVTLFQWGRELAANGGELVLEGASEQIRRMWRILGFNHPCVTVDGAQA